MSFAPRYPDLPAYIIGVTEEIWEGRRIASLRQSYGTDMVMRSTSGLVLGAEAVIRDTLASQAAFPDRQILADDVIWSEDGTGGFLSSHRSVIIGTHAGHGSFGAPTGRVVKARCIADCHVRDEVIDDEWLCYDAGAMVRQLGHTPEDWARRQIAQEGGAASARRPFTPDQDRPGPYAGSGNDHPLGRRLESILTRIMDTDFAVIGESYDRAVCIEHPGGIIGWGRPFAEAEWLQLRAAFPGARFRVHHRIGRADPGQPDRAAIRWSLDGIHDGDGVFGPASGTPIHVMGFTHAEFGPYGLRREFSLWDEVAIWKQIHLHRGAQE